jgi:hypothetical protein
MNIGLKSRVTIELVSIPKLFYASLEFCPEIQGLSKVTPELSGDIIFKSSIFLSVRFCSSTS